nr:RHS repeat-associated core domain-containing protein [uncultured Pseudomonas sp.]
MHQWMKLLGLCLLSICGAAHSAEVFVTYYHNDLLGSPVAATDESGKVLWREHFRPYGERQDTLAYRGYGSIGFTGHLQSQSNELVYMGARYYDPVIGRFLSVDPFGVDARKPKTLNRYIYAVGNPYAYIDPDGRQIVSVDAKDNGRIASWINNYASVRFGFNGNNQLQYIGGKTIVDLVIILIELRRLLIMKV